MEELAPHVWPIESRIGFCWKSADQLNKDCKMKEGNPFGPFWDELKVDFVDTVTYNLNYDEYSIDQWKQLFPLRSLSCYSYEGSASFISNGSSTSLFAKIYELVRDNYE